MFRADVRARPESGYVLVQVFGEIDFCTQEQFGEALTRAVTIGRSDDPSPSDAASAGGGPLSVVVDLSEVEFFGACGFRSLHEAEGLLSPPAALRLVCPERWCVRRIVSLLGLDRRWPVHTDVAEAITDLGR